jgi:fatty acid desaturase
VDPGDSGRRVRAIVAAIRGEERRLRRRHRWLAHQDALGLGCFAAALAAMAGLAWGYLAGALAWWAVVPAMALPLSVLHELEHDLIHGLYLRGRPRAQAAIGWAIAWAKLNASMSVRRRIHLHHHRRSGQLDDVEERLIGIGLPAGPQRLLIAVHPIFAGPVLAGIRAACPWFRAARGVWGSLPQFVVFAAVLLGWPLLALAPEVAPAGLPAVFEALMVLLVAPNVLRQTSLALVSSYCHYYADIPARDLFHQNQILDHPALWPLQLFCCNFGATHIIHHFVPQQPFYLRQMVARAAHAEMRARGIRRNDLGVVRRANRWA